MKGYQLNIAFNALARPEARAKWKADRAAYLDDFALTADERQFVLDDDWPACLDAGASVYTLTKVGAVTGESLLAMGARMRGETMAEFRAFIDAQNKRNAEHGIPFRMKGDVNG